MNRLPRLWPLAALSLLLACDSGEKPKDGAKDKKTADAKDKTDAKDKKDDKAADDKAKAKDATQDKAKDAVVASGTAKHFDVSKDKSGVLARSAAALEATDKLDNENLHDLSHHAEKLPSYEKVCGHEATLKGEGFDLEVCIKLMEHHMVQIGPDLYQQLADCILEAKTSEDIDVCEAAEAEAEALLHEKPHGDGLSKEVCDKLFTHFETLAEADAGDHASLVHEVLEEVRPDVIVTCMEQGLQAEVDCAMAAKDMPELKECASKIL